MPTGSSPPARSRNLKEKTDNVTTQLWLCQTTSVLPAVLMGDHLIEDTFLSKLCLPTWLRPLHRTKHSKGSGGGAQW